MRRTTQDKAEQYAANRRSGDFVDSEEDGNLFAQVEEEKPVKLSIQATASLNPTSTGILITGQVTEAEWEQVAENVVANGNALNWLLGDLYLLGANKDWGAYRRFAEKHHLEQRRLEDLIYVCRNVHYTVRTVGLSFTHHRMVAAVFDEDDPLNTREKQEHLLRYAAVNDLTVHRFREYLSALPATTTTVSRSGAAASDDSTQQSIVTTTPFWERPIDRLEKDFMRRWEKANSEDRQAALKRLKALVRELERMG